MRLPINFVIWNILHRKNIKIPKYEPFRRRKRQMIIIRPVLYEIYLKSIIFKHNMPILSQKRIENHLRLFHEFAHQHNHSDKKK